MSHGWAALSFGDDTAKRAGRLTLNPIAHIDPFGTILLPLLMSAIGFGVFGYAKPVPVNPRRMRSPRNQSLYTSLAGPGMNLAIALIAAVALRVLQPDGFTFSTLRGFLREPLYLQIVIYVGLVNVLLAVFNMIPLPPLDGSAVIERFLPQRYWRPYLQLRRYSMFVLIGILVLAPSAFSGVLNWAIRQWAKLL